MKRIEPAPVGADPALFQAELQLLDLMSNEIDGHCLAELNLSAEQLLERGLLSQKDFGTHITVQVDEEDGQRVYRRLEVQFDSAALGRLMT